MSPQQFLLMIIPSVTYPLICLFYVLVLKEKREEVDRLFQGETLEQYKKAYGVKDIFSQYYNWKLYILPLLLIMTAVIIVGYILQVKYEILILNESHIFYPLKNTPDTIIVGFAGAFIWTHYEMLNRYYLIDLSPIRLYYFWLRFLVSAIVAYLVGLSLQHPMDLIIAFAVGLFPVRTIMGFFRGQAQDKLKITDEITDFEKPNLFLLQGMTKNMIEQFNEENIYSIQQLALSNPIRLLMRTNIEWTIILDVIDQAILFNYVEGKMVELRKLGIRCAMEFSMLKKDIQMNVAGTEELIKTIAEKLDNTEEGIKNLIHILATDDQLIFISNLWYEAFPVQPVATRV